MAALPACSFVGVTAEVGFVQMAFGGDAALASASGGVPPGSMQSLESTMGLGSDLAAPTARAQLDLGAMVVTASGLYLRERGDGNLAATWGPIASGTAVRTELDFTNIKVSVTHDFGLGPLKVSPGIAVDLIDFRLAATESTFGNRGEIDQFLPLPMLFVRAEGDIGLLGLIAEVGYLKVPEIDGAEVALLDAELMLEYRLLPTVQLFGGYRLLDLDGTGETSDSSFAVDLTLDGWFIGGGIRF